MNSSDLKKMLINSLNNEYDSGTMPGRLAEEGVSYDFNDSFTDNVLSRIFAVKSGFALNPELIGFLNFTFSRIAITGIAAIIVLLISIFLMEGHLTINSILGLGDNYDEGIVYLLTGN
jgi:hypothetical protein